MEEENNFSDKEKEEGKKEHKPKVHHDSSHESHKNKDNLTEKFRENPWIVSTLILGIVALVLLVGNSGLGKNVSGDDAGAKVIEFLNAQTGGGVEYVSFKDLGGLYELTVSYKGQEIPVYATKDGKYFVQGATELSSVKDNPPEKAPPTEVPKTDKPTVELYVFTYCPYGTQAEKGIIPVAKLLGDKIDFKIRQIGAMHGEYEKLEAERQLCIEKEYPTKFLDYVSEFISNSEIGDCGGNADCVNPKIDALYTKLGINKAKIESCITKDGEALYSAEETNSRANGISGSPALMVNGVKSNAGRDSDSYLIGICNAFNNAPSECDTELSNASPSPGFGGDAGAGNSAASCG
ncbi:MAG: hypothetical protein AABX88_00910 [Nanoarchaeota archaeon]